MQTKSVQMEWFFDRKVTPMFNCKDCENRHVGCHADCESYKAEKAKCEAVRAKRQHENFVYYGVKDSNFQAIAKVMKKKKSSRR